ncbi:hypothetical protein CL689_03895 [Candidatus Saccharibacteria bacterium]|nr:hypothetical protein [Candidatus Saccharibacteria bacterium]
MRYSTLKNIAFYLCLAMNGHSYAQANSGSEPHLDFACSSLLRETDNDSGSGPVASDDYSTLGDLDLRKRVYEEPLAMIEAARRETLAERPDVDLIYGYLHRAQEKNSSAAAGMLSKLYEGRSGFPKDEKFKFYWLKKAADLGSIVACQEIGEIFHRRNNHYDAVRYLGNVEMLGGMHSESSLGALALSLYSLYPDSRLTEEYLERSARKGNNAPLVALVESFKKQPYSGEKSRTLVKLFSRQLEKPEKINSHTLSSLLALLTEKQNLEKYSTLSFGICVNLLHPTLLPCRYLMDEYRNLLTIEQMSETKALSAQQTLELLKLRLKDET